MDAVALGTEPWLPQSSSPEPSHYNWAIPAIDILKNLHLFNYTLTNVQYIQNW